MPRSFSAAPAPASQRPRATSPKRPPDGLDPLVPLSEESAHARVARESPPENLSADARVAIADAQETMHLHRRIHAAVADGAYLPVGLARSPPGLGVRPLMPPPP